MNIIELRQMMTAFKGSIWWKYKGIEVCISFDNSDVHAIPFLLINGKVICSTNAAFMSKNYLVNNLNHIFTKEEVLQIKYILTSISIYEPSISEELRFLDETLTNKAEFILCRTNL